MIRPLLSLERLFLDKEQGQVCPDDGRRQNWRMNAHPAGVAEKQIPIKRLPRLITSLLLLPGLSPLWTGWRMGVGPGFFPQKNLLSQSNEAFPEIADAPRFENPLTIQSLEDLPLIEVRAAGAEQDILAVHLTGDGGWGVTDRGLVNELAANGIPVVALNSLKYFWTRRTPEKAAADLERILKRYLSAWGKKISALIGYSLGADVLPFMLNRLPEDLHRLRGTRKPSGSTCVSPQSGAYSSGGSLIDIPCQQKIYFYQGRLIGFWFSSEGQ